MSSQVPLFSLSSPSQYPVIALVGSGGNPADLSDYISEDVFIPTSSFLFVRKTADETVTSSNVLQDDDHLLLTFAASSTYLFDLCVFFDGASTGDIKGAFTVPVGSVITWHQLSPTGSSTSPASTSMATSVISTSGVAGPSAGAIGAGTKIVFRARGIVRTDTTPGNLQFQWAQGTSDVVATTVFTDSFLTAQKVV